MVSGAPGRVRRAPAHHGTDAWVSDAGVTMLWWGCGDVPVTDMIALSKDEPVPDYLLPPLAE